MKKKFTDKQLPVAIYIRYDVNKTDNWEKEEELIKTYCQKKGYNVVKIFRDTEEHSCYYSEVISNIIINYRNNDYRRIIMYDIKEISEFANQIFAFAEILMDNEISIETLTDGVLYKDLLFGISTHNNVRDRDDLKNPPSIEIYPF